MFKVPAVQVAKQFKLAHFQDCQAALLSGSSVRGEATETSDLDIIIFDEQVPDPYRQSIVADGWPIEVFVHNLSSYEDFCEQDCKRARPSLPNMIAEGLVLHDSGIMSNIKSYAQALLEKGPDPWSDSTLRMKQYMISDALDDLVGSQRPEEDLFIANALSDQIHEFYLRTNRQWIGRSKWIVRALKQYDESFAEEFVQAFKHLYQTGDKTPVVKLTEQVLEPFGGRLFDGFSTRT